MTTTATLPAQFKTAVHAGKRYVTTTARGTEYTLSRGSFGWEVFTRRLALGRGHIGGCKHFATWADLQAGCKAFAALEIVHAI